MNILLTGSCGYVGSALALKLKAKGHNVTGIDTQWFRSDGTIPIDVRDVTDLNNADVIIHLAAVANDPSVAFYPRLSWETSVLATQQLADLAWRQGARFIYASSVSVYGANQGSVKESQPVKPLSDYNKTKICAERVLLSYPIKAQIIRPATICGLSPRMRLDLTVNMFAMQALTNGVITVNGGSQMRPSIHIDDMTDLYVWLLNHPDVYGVYNAGFENNSVMQIAQLVQSIIPCDIQVTPVVDARSYKVNSDKLIDTGFRPPQKTIENAINEIVAAYNAGTLKDDPSCYNLGWMTSQGIKDQ